MSNGKIIAFSVVGVIVLAIVGSILYLSQFAPDHWWSEHFDPDSEEPYGTLVFHDLVEHGADSVVVLDHQRVFENPDSLKGTVLAIGRGVAMDSVARQQFIAWLQKGNRFLLISSNPPTALLDDINGVAEHPYSVSYHNTMIGDLCLNNADTALSFRHRELKEDVSRYWPYLGENTMRDLALLDDGHSVEVLSSSPLTGPNFVSVDIGNGQLLWHVDPIYFTNYHLIRDEGLIVMEHALGYIPEGTVYTYHPRYTRKSEWNPEHKTILAYVLAQESLRNGIYVIIAMALLYIIFNRRRRQRPIPVIPQTRNSTLAFIEAAGILYQNQGNVRLITKELWDLFTKHVRDRYGLVVELKDQIWTQTLSEKSGIDPDTLTRIDDNAWKLINQPETNRKVLMALYQDINHFWKYRQ